MKAKKSLGQNFLIDKNVLLKISEVIPAKKEDLIIEIGPGRGALTKELIKKQANLICYEIDEDMHKYLDNLETNVTKIIYKDILSSDIISDIKNIKYNNLFIVGNLPYYITTPIIKHLISLNINPNKMVFMVQEEVANRFTANIKSKDYSAITLYLKYYFNVKKLINVSKYAFDPIPKVESAIISFDLRKTKLNIDENKYFLLLKDSFKMKRKTLKNNLKNYDFNKIKEVLIKYGYNDNIRAEEIPEEVFLEILKVI